MLATIILTAMLSAFIFHFIYHNTYETSTINIALKGFWVSSLILVGGTFIYILV